MGLPCDVVWASAYNCSRIYFMAYGKQVDADFLANTFELFLKGELILYL